MHFNGPRIYYFLFFPGYANLGAINPNNKKERYSSPHKRFEAASGSCVNLERRRLRLLNIPLLFSQDRKREYPNTAGGMGREGPRGETTLRGVHGGEEGGPPLVLPVRLQERRGAGQTG